MNFKQFLCILQGHRKNFINILSDDDHTSDEIIQSEHGFRYKKRSCSKCKLSWDVEVLD